ncbi:alpha/beta hydrolase family protein [Williamsia sp. M5A3_1d]
MTGPRPRSRRSIVDPRGIVALCGLVVLVTAVVVAATLPLTAGGGRANEATETSQDSSRTAAAPALAAMQAVVVRRYVYLDAPVGDPRQDYGDLFLPPGPHARGSLPLVVLVHGGGWNSRYGAGSFGPFARTLAARGLAVYNLEYRRLGSGGGWPTTFTDVAAGIDFVPTVLADNPAIDTADSTLVGHSAGAQLAVWAGTRRPTPTQPSPARPIWRPTRIISLAGPLDMRDAADTGDRRVIRALGGTPSQVPDRYRAVDPIENLDPTASITVVHGTADTVVRPVQSRSYVEALTRAGGRPRLLLLPKQSHSALVTSTSSAFPRVVDLIVSAARATP